jgi:predicted alpha/beta superfamily hydrolase
VQGDKMVIRWKVTIPSLTGTEERMAYAYLPDDYDSSNAHYPVLYMFDGHNLFTDEEATFGKCWGLESYLNKTKTPLIVAAVHGNHIVGKGKKYMDWLVTSFKPYIDQTFRTIPDRANTFISGSSMGGLMTMYALASYNKYFSKGASLSPSLWVGGEGVPPFIKNGKYGHDTVLYMDYGSNEFRNHAPQRQAFIEAYNILVEKGVFVTSRIVPFGTHSESSWEQQIPIFMKVLGL